MDVLKLLLDNGLDPNRVTNGGYTAFHEAITDKPSLEIVEMLISYGANNVDVKWQGVSAIEYARRKNMRGRIMELLESMSAIKPETHSCSCVVQ